jgi:hypothetical protein
MVAILEVGAFCSPGKAFVHDSLIPGSGSNRRHNRSTTNDLVRRVDFRFRWAAADLCGEHACHDLRTDYFWRRRRVIIVASLKSELIAGPLCQFTNLRSRLLITEESWRVLSLRGTSSVTPLVSGWTIFAVSSQATGPGGHHYSYNALWAHYSLLVR